MVTQKPISVRIDLDVLQQLDEEQRVSGKARNFMINRACKDYLRLIDIIRSCGARGVRIQDDIAFASWLTNVTMKRYHSCCI